LLRGLIKQVFLPLGQPCRFVGEGPFVKPAVGATRQGGRQNSMTGRKLTAKEAANFIMKFITTYW
jgi:hypothetical protein